VDSRTARTATSDTRRPKPLVSRPKPAVAKMNFHPHGSPAQERLARGGPVAALLYSPESVCARLGGLWGPGLYTLWGFLVF